MIDLQQLVRKNIRALISDVDAKAEQSERDAQHIMLDANEKSI